MPQCRATVQLTPFILAWDEYFQLQELNFVTCRLKDKIQNNAF